MRDTDWFKSSYSAAASDNCVEVRITDQDVSVRDTKSRAAGTLHMPLATWSALVNALA